VAAFVAGAGVGVLGGMIGSAEQSSDCRC
jgi:hypothetical protein